MKLPIKHERFAFITDNSAECNASTAFVKTAQNSAYENDAITNGAPVVLEPKECQALLGIDPALKIVGITGTNGKTTTAAAIYSLLLDLDKKVALQGTRGCFVNGECLEEKSLTTPPILQTLSHMAEASKQGCDYFIMEVSSHAIVQERIESLEFALKIFTNISQDHLDFHGSMAEYLAVKSSFFMDEAPKLINKDESKLEFNPKNCQTYGMENPSTYKVAAYSLQEGISAVIQNIEKMFDVHSNLYGTFNLYNLLCAVAAVDILEKPDHEALADAVEGFGGVSGRMEVVSEAPVVIVDFAHTPDGMNKVLDSMKNDDLVVLFGAGGDRDRSKRPLMGRIAQRFGKRMYVTSDNPRTEDPVEIIRDICEGVELNESVYIEPDRRKAIEIALDALQPNETLMILGKGDETYQEVDGVKHPFDDREIVREILKK